MDMWSQPPLRFDSGEILDLPADEPAEILHEPVEQRSEMQRIAGGLAVVVPIRVGRCAIAVHPAVAGTGQGHEQGRTEGLAVRCGEDLADRARVDLAPRQVRGVLAA